MLLICECCHSEYESEENFPVGEQLCPTCFKEFILDPQIDELNEFNEDIPDTFIDDYIEGY